MVSELKAFLDASPSVYHAAENLRKMVEDSGFTQLFEGKEWKLTPGGQYYLTRGGTSLIAFRIPESSPRGFVMTASHSDRPTFQLKENGVLSGTYTRLSTEKYGGMLLAPWLDRPLSLAGRVMVEMENGVQARLLNIDRDLLLIPNVAIHMNRAANDGYKWNPAVDTLPLLGGKSAELAPLLEKEAGGRVLGHDLTLYVRQKASIWGIEEEFISAQGLDDLQCAFCCTKGFLEAGQSRGCQVLCVFDSEEVGSCSVQGAASDLLETSLSRICQAMDWCLPQMLSQSFLVSADNAHALHPNHPELSDSQNAPVVNGGVVIKFNANRRYTTDGASAAVLRKIFDKAAVPVQTYCNRADIPGGSTLGNLSLAHVSVLSADIGLAQLAMHSCFETAGAKDTAALVTGMTAFYRASLCITPEGISVE